LGGGAESPQAARVSIRVKSSGMVKFVFIEYLLCAA
jgi:hypothetical protein